MKLKGLKVKDLRNLAEVNLDLCPHLNVILGLNGSGKTSLLEGIHLVSLARSFRTQQNRPLVRHGTNELTVFALIESPSGVHKLGVRKDSKGETALRLDGQKAKNSSALASLLPIQLITPSSHELLESGRKQRRAFIDWSLFHVKHDYLELWQRYVRTVRQRNAALHQSQQAAIVWNEALLKYGEEINRERQQFVVSFSMLVAPYIQQLLDNISIEFDYYPGWAKGKDFSQALADSQESEKSMGYTTVGPHRADLRIRIDKHPAIEILSRGQQKLLVCAMRLAQLEHLRLETGKTGVVLIDDLPSELDSEHRSRLLSLLEKTGAQVFVTATESELIDTTVWPAVKVFHVEHGQVKEVVQ